jgi:hypothetical protein
VTDSANLDLVRSIYADWERGDYSSTEWADSQIEYVIADGPAPGSWTGLAAMARRWGDVLTAWEDFTQRGEEYRELDAERVLVLTRATARAKASGVELAEMWVAGVPTATNSSEKRRTLLPGRRQSKATGRLLRPRPRPRRPRPGGVGGV